MKSLLFNAILLSFAGMILAVFAGYGVEARQSPDQFKRQKLVSDYLRERYEGGKEHLVKLAEAMPEANYAFQPTSEMEPFGVRIAHIARMNFWWCAYFVGKPEPHKGVDLGKTVTQKVPLVQLLKDSFTFCDGYMLRLSPQVMAETLTSEVVPGRTMTAELGGAAIDLVSHNSEMYGYLAVYLRLKGITPPTSGPARKQ